MSVELNDSNIHIYDGSKIFKLEIMSFEGTRTNKDIVDLNVPTIIPNVDINKISYNDDYNYLIFTYNESYNYPYINADITNLIAWYKFDNSTDDSSSNGNNLTNYNTHFQSLYSVTGSAISFDSSADYLEFPYSIDPYLIWVNNGISFSFWYRITSAGSYCRFIDFQDGASKITGILIGRYASTNNLTINIAGSGDIVINNLFMIDSKWHHIVFSINPDGIWKINMDGYNINISKSVKLLKLNYTIRYINKSSFSADGTWNGQMDDFRIYNKVLSDDEINTLYNRFYDYAKLESDNNNLIVHYKFDDNGNNEGLVDSNPSSIKHNLIIENNVTPTYNTNSIFGKSIFENNIEAKIKFPQSLSGILSSITENNGITFSLWYNMNILSNAWAPLFEFSDSSTDTTTINRITLSKNNANNNLNITIKNNNTISQHLFGTIDNNWHHIAWSINNSGLWNIYFDGIPEILNISRKIPNITNYNFSFLLGSVNSSQSIASIDDFRIYKKVLTEVEVNSIFNSAKKYNQTKYTLSFPHDTLCDILVVAGGGGGGMDMGGGGGGGGVIYKKNYMLNSNQIIPIYVGNGGSGAPAANTNGQPSAHNYTINGTNGANTIFDNLVAIGGGYGGTSEYNRPLGGYGNKGGSGGGAGGYWHLGLEDRSGNGIPGQGNKGGARAGINYSGGGGGAGEIGGSGTAPGSAKGGNGLFSDIMGIGYYWGGGGGGSGYSTTGGNGGLGGGGGGAVNNTIGGLGYTNGDNGGGGGTNSYANTPGGNGGKHTGGGGGGGAHYQGFNKGGDGGSGIVIVRYKSQYGTTNFNYEAQWKYNNNTPFVDYYGNVAIGTKSTDNYTLNIKGNINISGDLYNNNIKRNHGNYFENSKSKGPIIIHNAIRTAEDLTGVKGWHYVKFLSSASTDWYPSYGNRDIIPKINNKYIFDDFGSFDNVFPNIWNEVIFIRDDRNMYNSGSSYGVQYVYADRTMCETMFSISKDWSSLIVKKTQDGFNTAINYNNYFTITNYQNMTPFILCKNRNSSPTTDLVYHEKTFAVDGSLGNDSVGIWSARTSQVKNTEYHVLVRNSLENNRISSIIPKPFYTSLTKYLEFNAEKASGVNGWRLVRFLPPTSQRWYNSNNDNLAGTTTYGTSYDYNNEFSVPFGNFDEFLFSTTGMKHWLHTTKNDAIGNVYDNVSRKIIKSSIIPMTYYARWYNRSANLEDPWIGLRDHGAQPINNPYNGGDLILYSESGAGHWSQPAISIDGGMCVFVRNTNDNNQNSHNTEYKLLEFEHSTGFENQTEYIIDFPTETLCDILVIGGGGAGGFNAGGGGGAGGLVYGSNILMKGEYYIKIGRGGISNNSTNDNGEDTIIYNEKYSIIASGGGAGADAASNGLNGASGGGGASGNSGADNIGGIKKQITEIQFENKTLIGYGNNGGLGRREESGGNTRAGGGGGGAGEDGNTSGNYGSDLGQSARIAYGGDGGNGKEYEISGIKKYYAGGGGGGIYNNLATGFPGIGGLGGGGNGGQPNTKGIDGAKNTGSGGGAGGANMAGGNGGSGIIIIKYRDFETPNKLVLWTYNSKNSDVYYMGNLAINKENAVSKVDVNGDITGTSKNFKISHPLGYNKWLLHSSIEAPRYDNIYRGKKKLTKGKAIVDIDTECNETGGMTKGTFNKLNKNPQLYLRNNKTFDKVKGNIKDGIIYIYCEKEIDNIEINWMVIGERMDDSIKLSELTDNTGSLICERYMSK